MVVSTRHIHNYGQPGSSNREGEKAITHIDHAVVSTRHILNYDKPCSSNREGEKAITICLSITFIMWWFQLYTFITMTSHVLQIEKERRPSQSAHYIHHVVVSTRHIQKYDKPCSSNREGEKAITICLSITFIMWWYQQDTFKTMTSPVLQIEKEIRPSLST